MSSSQRMIRLALLGAALLASLGSSQTCVTTLFAADNGGSLGGAVYFDVTVLNPAGITVQTMQINTAELATLDLTVYTTPGSHVGVETNPGLWTPISTGQGIGQGRDIPTDVDVADFSLATGTWGMALVLGPTAGHDYTGGLGAQTHADANIQLDLGTASNVPFTATIFSPRVWNGQICYQVNTVTCAITTPAPGTTVSGEALLQFDTDHVLGLAVDATVDFSLDAGVTWSTCTPGVAYTNPIPGIATPATGVTFGWDTLTDAVGLVAPATADIRVSVTDGVDTGTCAVDVVVDNVVPSPLCTLTLTGGSPARSLIEFELTADVPSGSGVVDAAFDYTTDGGATFQPATPSAASANPLIGVPAGTPTIFEWDSRADGVGLAALQPLVQMQATLTDAAAPLPGVCLTATFDVDNTSLCPGDCGDCNESGTPGITVLDALVAAQISAALVTPSAWQTGCCDVDSSMTITVLDALIMAQEAAALAPGVTCP